MSDNKISQLDQAVVLRGRDLLLIVSVPSANSSSNSNVSSNLDWFLSHLPSNTHILANCSVQANTTSNNVIILNSSTPANNQGLNVKTGTIWSDGNYIYVKEASKIKRVSLSDF